MAYTKDFIAGFQLETPKLPESLIQLYADLDLNVSSYFLDYLHYSLQQHPVRAFPIYTASNINGKLFKQISRSSLFSGSDRWKKDDRIPAQHQLGHELYKADRSDFDKGHLTKREDVQWAPSEELAKSAAESTFFFTNAVPQVPKLNRGIWRRIEDYILHSESIDHALRICLFTGPVLSEMDPPFVTRINDQVVQIPHIFWKVVYYKKDDQLFRTAFLVSQKNELEKNGIVEESYRDLLESTDDPFMQFKDAETYQVRTEVIEEITGLSFHNAKEQYTDDRATLLILHDVDIRSLESTTTNNPVINLTI